MRTKAVESMSILRIDTRLLWKSSLVYYARLVKEVLFNVTKPCTLRGSLSVKKKNWATASQIHTVLWD